MRIIEYELNEHENQLTVQQVRREEQELENDDVLDVNEEEFESNPEQPVKLKRRTIKWLYDHNFENKDQAVEYIEDLEYKYLETRRLVKTEKIYFECNKGIKCKSKMYIQATI